MQEKFLYYIKGDLFRYAGNTTIKSFLKQYIKAPGFRFTFWMRLCHFQYRNRLARCSIFPFTRLVYNHYRYKFGIDIPYGTKIGRGLLIYHFSCIVINVRAKIGENFTISHGVTIGDVKTGQYSGTPAIGDNVYFAPGSKAIGGIKIGNNSIIAANSVVTKDVPENYVIAGIPGKKVSENGSSDYIKNPLLIC